MISNVFGKLLCWLGTHDWELITFRMESPYLWRETRECTRCKKTKEELTW